MQMKEITLALFVASNSIRAFAYVPQIQGAATDKNGASAISRTTWSLFFAALLSTIGYQLVNRSDFWLAICVAGNALCCVAILAITWWKGQRHAASLSSTKSEPVEAFYGTRAARRVHSQMGSEQHLARALLLQ